MRILVLLCWCLCFSWGSFAQKKTPDRAKTPQEIERLAKYYFDQGDYFRAANLYKFELGLALNSEEEQDVNQKYEKSLSLFNLTNELVMAVINNNEIRRKEVTSQILALNPDDQLSSSSMLIVLERPNNNIKSLDKKDKEDKQTIRYAEELIAKKRYYEAYRYLIAFKGKSPKIDFMIATLDKKIKNIREVKEDSCDSKKYISLRKKMDNHYLKCELQQAKSVATQIFEMDCYKNDLYSHRLVRTINGVQQELRALKELRNSGDQSKQEFILQGYKKLIIKHKPCVEWDYFYYVYYKAERKRAKNPCDKSLLEAYFEAQKISGTLATNERVQEKIEVLKDCADCQDKIALFIKLSSEAKELFGKCQLDDALVRFTQAEQILGGCTSEIIVKIQDEWVLVKQNIEEKKSIKKRFDFLILQADGLSKNNKCDKAYPLYLEAENIYAECFTVDKGELKRKMKTSYCCRQNYLFDSLLNASKRSTELNYRQDRKRFFLLALDLVKKDSLRCISEPQIKKLKDTLCREYQIECPPLDNTKKIYIDSSAYYNVEVFGGAFYDNPALKSVVRPKLPAWGWGGWNIGASFILRDKKTEFKGTVSFTQNRYDISQNTNNKETFDYGLVKAGAEISPYLSKSKKMIRLYTTFGVHTAVSTNATYTKNDIATKIEKPLSGIFGVKLGLGLIYKQKWTVTGLFNLDANNESMISLAPLSISQTSNQTLGINVGYRIFTKYPKTKN
jgi:hypothetical protein